MESMIHDVYYNKEVKARIFDDISDYITNRVFRSDNGINELDLQNHLLNEWTHDGQLSEGVLTDEVIMIVEKFGVGTNSNSRFESVIKKAIETSDLKALIWFYDYDIEFDDDLIKSILKVAVCSEHPEIEDMVKNQFICNIVENYL